MRALPLLVAVVPLWVGCPKKDPPAHAPPSAEESEATGCAAYAAAQKVGELPSILPELSGLAASREEGVWWAHNDSGNALELVAITSGGEHVASFPLAGATADDPEDLAVGPCAPHSDERCIYLGNIGDNRRVHADRTILRVREPDPRQGATLTPEVLRFRYPDGPRDAEALVVDRGADVYVLSKTPDGLGALYRVQTDRPGATVEAVKVATLPSPGGGDGLSTAADLHPSGERLIVRTYGHVWEFASAGATDLAALVASAPTERPAAPWQIQPEAIAYIHSGAGYLMGSEGEGAPLYLAGCAR